MFQQEIRNFTTADLDTIKYITLPRNESLISVEFYINDDKNSFFEQNKWISYRLLFPGLSKREVEVKFYKRDDKKIALVVKLPFHQTEDSFIVKDVKNTISNDPYQVYGTQADHTYLASMKDCEQSHFANNEYTLELDFIFISKLRDIRKLILIFEYKRAFVYGLLGLEMGKWLEDKLDKSFGGKGGRTSLCEKLLKNPEFTDFNIKVDDKFIPIHKFIFASQSSVFKGILSSGLKEVHSGVLEIKIFSYGVVQEAIRFLYTGVIAQDVNTDTLNGLFSFASYFDLAGLTACSLRVCLKSRGKFEKKEKSDLLRSVALLEGDTFDLLNSIFRFNF